MPKWSPGGAKGVPWTVKLVPQGTKMGLKINIFGQGTVAGGPKASGYIYIYIMGAITVDILGR